MKRYYEAPEAEIEKFSVVGNICTVSNPHTGNEGGDTEYDF